MINKSGIEKNTANREVVQRYCPHIGDNVVMMVSAGGDEKEFECIRRDNCDHSGGKVCRKTQK